ncbi:hypothetical protein KF707_05300, partial [Candidatus Obscuribacterales bacterium]|nr:hypothetical protein [Candidatus Obscuribacterales bacterium]
MPAFLIAVFAAKPANKIAALDFSLGKEAFELENTAPANKIAAFAAKPANKIAALDFSLGKEAFELENT